MAKVRAGFIEPMLLLRADRLPEDRERWEYQVKQDGYRAVAFKTGGVVHLRSRNDNDFSSRYPTIATALSGLPNETVIDGEVVALGADGRPSFGLLQNAAGSSGLLVFFVFDVMTLAGRDVTGESFAARRALLEARVLPTVKEPIRYAGSLDAPISDLIAAVKAARFEGLVAKRRDSRYESGQRSGAWQKMRINAGQELVIGGYTVGSHTFDALVLGYYEAGRLIYAARTRNGFTPALRGRLFKTFAGLATRECPFANLPEAKSGRWGEGLTKAKMADCRWLQPVLVAQIEFVEWTSDNHLRHSKFVALRDDKKAADVRRESRS